MDYWVHMIMTGSFFLNCVLNGKHNLLKLEWKTGLPYMGKTLHTGMPNTLVAAHICHIPMYSWGLHMVSMSLS